MPVIGNTDGITLRMYFEDHPPPHFHATINEYSGLFDVKKGKVIKGNLKLREQHLVETWMKNRRKILLEMWESQNIFNAQNFNDYGISQD